MDKSSGSSSRQSPGQVKSPLHQFACDPRTLRRAHAAVHRFVEHFDAEVEAAVRAAHGRQLAAIRRVEQSVRYLYSRYLLTDQAAGTSPKPQGLVLEPDFILVLKNLDAVSLAGCLSRLHDAIVALEPYDGVRFDRKPLGLQNAGGKAKTGKKANSESAAAGPEETTLAALELAGHELTRLFRSLAEWMAASSTTRAAQRKTPKGQPSGILTPPQVAEKLGVSADKVRGWISRGELNATDVAAEGSSRPRFRISPEDLAEFQKKRQPSKPPLKPPRRRKKDPHVIEFFK